MSRAPNEVTSAAGREPVLVTFGALWPTPQGCLRLMKSGIFLGVVLACLAPRFAWAEAQRKPPQSGAPTGTYVPWMEAPKESGPWQTPVQTPLFALRLETNGTYVARTTFGVPTQDGDLFRLLPEVVRGKWHWDAEKREFRLEPGDFLFYIKCLPVDKQHTNRLVWGESWLVREKNK